MDMYLNFLRLLYDILLYVLNLATLGGGGNMFDLARYRGDLQSTWDLRYLSRPCLGTCSDKGGIKALSVSGCPTKPC